MVQLVKMSFEGSYEDRSPMVVVHNPQVFSAACLSQVKRFGIVGATVQKPLMSGKLKGTRKALVEMIQSYGFSIEIVPAPSP
jgi:hypothetical protein